MSVTGEANNNSGVEPSRMHGGAGGIDRGKGSDEAYKEVVWVGMVAEVCCMVGEVKE